SFTTYVPSFGDEELLDELRVQGVEVETRPAQDGGWWPIVWMVLPFLFLLLLGWMAIRRMRAQGQSMFSIGKAGAKLYDEEKAEKTTFDDVAGAEGPKKELQEVIEFLKDPERFHRLGGEIPRGVLMVGPPGTGKTLMARAVAGEAGVPFYSITGSDFMEMFVGVGAKRVRDLFETAKQTAPAIVFIDELDSIGRRRGAGLGGGHDEREQTLNQLLSELDGFEPNDEVIVMAATNRPDILDPALLRPGRFDRRVTVHLPTTEARLEILRIHAKNKPLAPEVDLEKVAQGTPGLSGADLENLLNEAALIAARRGADRIANEDLDEARDKVLMGLEREGIALTDDEREMLAYHEAGHALVAAVLPNTDPIHKVTIVPRGRAMGVTQQLPEREKYIYEKEYMMDRAAVMMGGRAAEELVFETATSGAEDDLQQVTKLARKMVLDWGMSEALGRMSPGGRRQQVFLGEEIAQQREYSDETAREVDKEVQRLVEASYRRAREVLEEHRGALDRMAERLIEEEELTGDQVLEIVDGGDEDD
ncbi:MAG TPA: ATP-dependent zinc metalloprotease FtsH, partial [Longimicrobiales bacterium]|nr:ATP-dependent zinc metalloprotease FtsH [Longimicrobiales bacterium]